MKILMTIMLLATCVLGTSCCKIANDPEQTMECSMEDEEESEMNQEDESKTEVANTTKTEEVTTQTNPTIEIPQTETSTIPTSSSDPKPSVNQTRPPETTVPSNTTVAPTTPPETTIPPTTAAPTTAAPTTEAPTTVAPTIEPSTAPPQTTAPVIQNVLPEDLQCKLRTYVIDNINVIRSNNNLHPLKMDGSLVGFAAIRAHECSILWSHMRPDGSRGCDLVPVAKWRGENLAKIPFCGFDYSDEAIEIVAKRTAIGWNNSPKHQELLLKQHYNYIGVYAYGVKNSDNKITFYIAAMFSS